MKKFFVLAIISILCLSFLTACGPSAAPPDFEPYWGQLINEGKNYLEYSEYKIEARSLTDANGNPLNKTEYKLDPAYSSGVYTTTLTLDSRSGATSTYKLTNSYKFTGRYSKVGSDPIDFVEDSYESEVIFRVSALEFTTLSSKKTVKQASFFDLNEKFEQGEFKQVSYEITNTYDKDKNVESKLKFDAAEKDNSDVFKEIINTTFTGHEIINTTYTAHMGDSYFDNESLFFGIRSRKPDETFSLGYNVLNPIDREIKNMQAAYVAQATDEDGNVEKPIKLAAINNTQPTINGTVTTNAVECYLVQAKLNETNSGAPINLYYAKNYEVSFLDKNEKTYNKTQYYFLVKYEHGEMIYTLNMFDNNAIKKA